MATTQTRAKTKSTKTSPVKTSYTYSVKAGAHFSEKDAQTIGPYITALTEQNGGMITSKQLWNHVRADPNAPAAVRAQFEWNKDKAYNNYNIQRARLIIKSISFDVKSGKVEIDFGAFERVTNNGELPNARIGSGYVKTTTVVQHQSFVQQQLEQALRDLRLFEARYRRYEEVYGPLLPIFQAVAQVEKALKAKGKLH